MGQRAWKVGECRGNLRTVTPKAGIPLFWRPLSDHPWACRCERDPNSKSTGSKNRDKIPTTSQITGRLRGTCAQQAQSIRAMNWMGTTSHRRCKKTKINRSITCWNNNSKNNQHSLGPGTLLGIQRRNANDERKCNDPRYLCTYW